MRLALHALADPERRLEQAMELGADGPERDRRLKGLAKLTDDVDVAEDLRLEAGRDPQQMPNALCAGRDARHATHGPGSLAVAADPCVADLVADGIESPAAMQLELPIRVIRVPPAIGLEAIARADDDRLLRAPRREGIEHPRQCLVAQVESFTHLETRRSKVQTHRNEHLIETPRRGPRGPLPVGCRSRHDQSVRHLDQQVRPCRAGGR